MGIIEVLLPFLLADYIFSISCYKNSSLFGCLLLLIVLRRIWKWLIWVVGMRKSCLTFGLYHFKATWMMIRLNHELTDRWFKCLRFWLIELSEHVDPTTELHGFDLYATHFPSSEWLPSNITLSQLDILKPDDIPEQYLEAFDVVNARLLVTLLHRDPSLLLQTIGRMLKPGGWLQWIDFRDPTGITKIKTPRPGLKMDAMENITRVHKGLIGDIAIKQECVFRSSIHTVDWTHIYI